MRALYLLSVWLHILAAVVWLGGILFLTLVLVPAIRRSEYRRHSSGLFHHIGVRFRWIGWICYGLLIASGTLNLVYRGVTWETVTSLAFWTGPWGRLLGIKLLLVAVILLASAYHDFVVGPRSTAAARAHPGSPESQRLRRQASWVGRFNLVMGLVVVLLAVMLVRGGM